jgi:hypothetical protein
MTHRVMVRGVGHRGPLLEGRMLPLEDDVQAKALRQQG